MTNYIQPNLLDRVYSRWFGYGTVIEVLNNCGYSALVLFDIPNDKLHDGDSSTIVPEDVRQHRCYFGDILPFTEDREDAYDDVFVSIPFNSEEYRRHPVRFLVDTYDSETKKNMFVPASLIAAGATINTDGTFPVAFDSISWHDGLGLSSWYDKVINKYWKEESEKRHIFWGSLQYIRFDSDLLNRTLKDNPDLEGPCDEDFADSYVDEDEALEDEDAWEGPVRDAEEEEKKDVEEEGTVASPSYYKIARVEPNELMADLMSFEQHEGFLWGNIIKYAYRYGNKGEKAETVKKIRKYCDMLLEILEPKSELED